MAYRTAQENFWAGDFGSEYIRRNQRDERLASNLSLFGKALGATSGAKSGSEFEENVGMNLKPIKLLHLDIDARAIEINSKRSAIWRN